MPGNDIFPLLTEAEERAWRERLHSFNTPLCWHYRGSFTVKCNSRSAFSYVPSQFSVEREGACLTVRSGVIQRTCTPTFRITVDGEGSFWIAGRLVEAVSDGDGIQIAQKRKTEGDG